MTRTRWHYTNLSFLEAFSELTEAERADYPVSVLRRQSEKLDALGEAGWDVYEIKFDGDGYPLYFLRRVLD